MQTSDKVEVLKDEDLQGSVVGHSSEKGLIKCRASPNTVRTGAVLAIQMIKHFKRIYKKIKKAHNDA